MSKQFHWAKSYIEKYEAWLEQKGTSGTTSVGGVEYELYELAKAIVNDVHGDKP